MNAIKAAVNGSIPNWMPIPCSRLSRNIENDSATATAVNK